MSLPYHVKNSEFKNKTGYHPGDDEVTTLLDLKGIIHQEENIYLNVFNINDSLEFRKAEYINNQFKPILEKGSDYKMYVENFDLRVTNAPMFINSSRELTIALYHAPSNLTFQRTALKTLYPDTYLFFSEHFVLNNPDGINKNIEQAFIDLVNAYEAINGPGSWIANGNPANPPFILYDTATGFFNVYNDVDSIDSQPNAVQLYINNELYTLIGGLPLDFPVVNFYGNNSPTLLPPQFAKVTFEPAGDNANYVTINGSQYIQIPQAYRTLTRWWSIRTIVLTSATLGIREPYIAGAAQLGETNLAHIIKTFEIRFDDRRESPPGSTFIYFPRGLSDRLDITNDNEIRQLYFQLEYADEFGNIFPVTLNPQDSFHFTLCFTKRIG